MSRSDEERVADIFGAAKETDDLAVLLEEILSETGGPLTARECAAADRALGR